MTDTPDQTQLESSEKAIETAFHAECPTWEIVPESVRRELRAYKLDELSVPYAIDIAPINHRVVQYYRVEKLEREISNTLDRLQRAYEQRDQMRLALEWYGEQARLCRLIHSEGDIGRALLDADGGRRARAALEPKP